MTKFCAHCNRLTQHKVSSGRVGRCMEHEAPLESKRQTVARRKREEAAANPLLFPEHE